MGKKSEIIKDMRSAVERQCDELRGWKEQYDELRERYDELLAGKMPEDIRSEVGKMLGNKDLALAAQRDKITELQTMYDQLKVNDFAKLDARLKAMEKDRDHYMDKALQLEIDKAKINGQYLIMRDKVAFYESRGFLARLLNIKPE